MTADPLSWAEFRGGLDRTGRDAADFRELPGGLREPVLDDAHRAAMISDLYSAGWSYRLIAQLAGMTSGQVFDTSPPKVLTMADTYPMQFTGADREQFAAWQAKCRHAGVASSMNDAIRLAVRIAMRIPADQLADVAQPAQPI